MDGIEQSNVTAIVVSSRGTAERARITARSVAENGRANCLIVDVDGTYVPAGTETVMPFGELVDRFGAADEAQLAAATLDADAFEFYVEVLGASAAASGSTEGGVVVLAPGVVVLADLHQFAALARGGLAVLPRSDPNALLRRLHSSSSLRNAAMGYREVETPTDEILPQFARTLYALGHGADIGMLRRLASDWRIALTALDVYAVSRSAVIVRDEACLIAAWRGTPSAELTHDDSGALLLDEVPVLAVDLSHFDPAKPWVLDAKAPVFPAIRLSEQTALRDLVSRVSSQFAVVLDDDDAADQSGGPIPKLDPVLLTEARRAHLLGGELPDLLGLTSEVDDLDKWATALVPPGHRHPVARYLAGVRANRFDLQRAFPRVPGTDSVALGQWALRSGVNEDYDSDLMRRSGELTLEAQPVKTSAGARPPGVNLIGYLSGELGLGESARLVDAALHSAGVPTSTFDISLGLLSRTSAVFRKSDSTLYNTTLACVNGSEVGEAFKTLGDVVARTRRIGMWYWELEDFPIAHQAGFNQVHEVWAATDFIRDAIAAHSEGVPVRTVMPPLPQRGDEEVDPLPERFGIRPDRPFFLFTFDYLSLAGRKNPYGLIDAFTRAFPDFDDNGPLLVIKTINGDEVPADSERLRIEAAPNPNVLLIDEYLDNHERHMLVAHCAAYVSLHKAEGLGLTIAEAMAWGKPVIATAYGGPLQFMTAQNSFAVRWTPGFVPERMGPYEKGLRWAEPDLDDAARLMRLVVEDPATAAAVGDQAARDIRELHNIEAAGARIREVLDEGHREWEAARAAKRARRQDARRLRQLQESPPPASVPRRALRKARRVSADWADRIRGT